MTDVQTIAHRFATRASSMNFDVTSVSLPDKSNTVRVAYKDGAGNSYAFQTDGQMFRLNAGGYDFLEFEYEEAYASAMADDLVDVSKAVRERDFTATDRAHIEVRIGDKFFGGQLPRRT